MNVVGRRKEKTLSQEEIDKRIEEAVKKSREEDEKEHTAWIVLKNGYTYIGYDVYDQITEKLMSSLRKLITLMGVSYSIRWPFDEYYIILDGEDTARAEFIQKFFDNGYKLSW